MIKSGLFSETLKGLQALGQALSIPYLPVVVQLLGRVRLFATPWTAARQASLSVTNSRSLLKLKFMESVMPSSPLILCRPLLLLPSVFPSIRIFSSESVLLVPFPYPLPSAPRPLGITCHSRG